MPLSKFEIYARAIELSGQERDAFLQASCGHDPELRSQVDHLLAHDVEDDFLATPPAVEALKQDPIVGSKVGPYVVRSLIAEGGMGTVYLAEQCEPITRSVALKIIKAGMDTKQVLARFEAERQTLALLDHPNIAKILDAGRTEGGRSYFVMEHVSGMPVTTFCDQHKLSLRERLELVKTLCAAVHHAHQKGIIHRDLKPSNILVSSDHDRPVPKVIDFGIAKATSGSLTDLTLVTQPHQFVGTPAYTSPEQLQGGGNDVDTRTDVYSLGVLLYELLTGTTPIAAETAKDAANSDRQRLILERDPPTPSSRITELRKRSLTDPQIRLPHSKLNRELDWVVMKALEKDRDRRYESVAAFSKDIERFLNGDPVAAAPPSRLYRLRKWTQRHHAASGAILGVSASLLIGTGVALYGMVQARQAQREAVTIAYLADMQAAHQALRGNNLALAKRILEHNHSFPANHDPRHWEWRALWQQCQSDAARTFGHPRDQRMDSLAMSPDGQWVATAANEGLRIWNFATGELLATLQEDTGTPRVVFAPNGKAIYTSDQQVIRSWSFPELELAETEFQHDREIEQLEISPDGRWLAALGNDEDKRFVNLAVWDLQTGQLRERREMGRGGGEGDLDFTRDGNVLGVGLFASVRMLDVTTLEETAMIDASARAALAFSPDGQFAACSTGVASPRFKIHNVSDGSLVKELEGHLHAVHDVAYSPDGRFMASVSGDHTIVLWDAATYQKLKTFRGHEGIVYRVRFTPDGQSLLSCGSGSRVFVWDLRESFEPSWPLFKAEAVHPRIDGLEELGQVSFTADGRWLASTRHWNQKETRGFAIRSPQDMKVKRVLLEGEALEIESDARLRSLRCSPVDPNVVAAGWHGVLYLVDAATGTVIRRLQVRPNGPVYPVQFSSDGETLLVAAPSKDTSQCLLYRVADLQEVDSWHVPGLLKAAALAPDGSQVALAGVRGYCILPRGQSTSETPLVDPLVRISAFDYSPDGSLLALASSSRSIQLIDPRSGQSLGRLTGHTSTVRAVRFSPDGKRLASAGHGKLETLKLWDVATRREILTLEGQGGAYANRQVEWSPDGNAIVVMGGAGDISLWRVPSLAETE